ncbi:uncharacterized protein [Dysidea avara]|uniref:uncharacterized protein n=1 Tax=Dysidea avara TaxID=196820 RepID=UPI0033215FE3
MYYMFDLTLIETDCSTFIASGTCSSACETLARSTVNSIGCCSNAYYSLLQALVQSQSHTVNEFYTACSIRNPGECVPGAGNQACDAAVAELRQFSPDCLEAYYTYEEARNVDDYPSKDVLQVLCLDCLFSVLYKIHRGCYPADGHVRNLHLELACSFDSNGQSCLYRNITQSPEYATALGSLVPVGGACSSFVSDRSSCSPTCAMQITQFVEISGCCWHEAYEIIRDANDILSRRGFDLHQACGFQDPGRCPQYNPECDMAETALEANSACSTAYEVYSQSTDATDLSANVLNQLCIQSCRNLVAAKIEACDGFASRSDQGDFDLTCAIDEDDGKTCAIIDMEEGLAFERFDAGFGFGFCRSFAQQDGVSCDAECATETTRFVDGLGCCYYGAYELTIYNTEILEFNYTSQQLLDACGIAAPDGCEQFGVGGGDGGADIVNGLGLLTMLLFAVMAMFI